MVNIFLIFFIMGCNSACVTDIPAFPSAGCEIVTRSSGISKLIFAQCDLTFTDITDLAEWTTHLTANKVHSTGKLKGSKPKGSFTKLKLSACEPEKIVNGEKSVAFIDANADDTSYAGYTFYNYLMSNMGNVKMYYVDCNDNLYGAFENIAIEVDDVRTDNSDDVAVFDGVVTWKDKLMSAPINIPGLSATLT